LFDTNPTLGCLICDRFERRAVQENQETGITCREVDRGGVA
jgi:hypothetical protein